MCEQTSKYRFDDNDEKIYEYSKIDHAYIHIGNYFNCNIDSSMSYSEKSQCVDDYFNDHL